MFSAERKSIAFNNAGVECLLAGQPRVAWDLFKGALEVLVSHRSNESAATAATATATATDTYVSRAESHLNNLDCYLDSTSSSLDETKESGLSLATRPSVAWAEEEGGTASADNLTKRRHGDLELYEYRPYLCSSPFRISQDSVTAKESRNDITTEVGIKNARSSSATIIFNLALVDHLHNRSSRQAISLYELATTLVVGHPVDTVGIALINNIGVWCFENGDVSGVARCMEHLSRIINRGGSALVSAKDRDGLMSNIMWMLNPPKLASPAA